MTFFNHDITKGFNYKIFKNETFLLIFHHNSYKKQYFTQEEAGYNIEQNKYSIINIIDESYKIKYNEGEDNEYSAYEFLLEYPELDGYNQWTQEVYMTEEIVPDNDIKYRPINISWDYYSWGGLYLSSMPNLTYIDGSPNDGTWHYGIGVYHHAFSDNDISGPCNSIDYCKNQYFHIVNLWIRVTDVILTKKHNCSCFCSAVMLHYASLLFTIFIGNSNI